MSRRVGTSGEREACAAASFDGASCRLFLCARCRTQVLICRRCDRGQTYCAGICAQEARRERQREARRRYQATPRGRAMHAERNRRYRVRRRCVTDHGLSGARGERFVPPVNTASTEQPRSATAPGLGLCHRCRRSASAFLRLSFLSRRRVGRRFRRPPW
jgi:hypothetical protein